MDRILPKSLVEDLVPFTYGDLFYADTTTTLARLPVGSETQVLNVATGIPTWTSTITLTGLTVKDSLFNIVGNVDDTKKIKFQVDNQTTGDTLTFDTGAQTDSRTLTVPVLTGNATLATLEETQTFTGAKTFSNSSGVNISATTGTTLTVSSTTDATSISTGSIVTSGGIGVAKRLTLDGATGKTLRIVNGVANAAVATTLGSVGPTGSTAGDPQGWMRVDINGTDRYIPYW